MFDSILLIIIVVILLYLINIFEAIRDKLNRNNDLLEDTIRLLDRIEANTEKTYLYIYEQTDEYREHVREIEDLKP